MKCKRCGAELNDNIKNCVSCGLKNPTYTHFHIGNTPIRISKPLFIFAIVLCAIAYFVIMLSILSNSSDTSDTDSHVSNTYSNIETESIPSQEEKHKHNWGKSTCEKPATCIVCGETKNEDAALGHTTDCGICSRCQKEFRKQSPVTITNWTHNIDYFGGVEWNFKIKNNTNKQIKYITLKWDCYNAVGDLIYDEIGWKSYVKVKFTGPLDAYATTSTQHNMHKFYNNTLRNYKMSEITVEYMDGTTEEVTQYHDNIIN